MTTQTALLSFAAFGLWTLLSFFAGAWLMYRKQTYQAPVPSFDPAAMMNWIRSGKAQKPEGEPPPFDPEAEKPVQFEL
jgi:hypothetical protein